MLSVQDQSFEITIALAKLLAFFNLKVLKGSKELLEKLPLAGKEMAELIIPVKKGGVIGSKWLQILQYAQVDGA